MRVSIKVVGFMDADGRWQLTLLRYPTEVIYLEGRGHWYDEDSDRDGRVDFHDEATQLPEWCANHRLTYYSGEGDFILNANG